MKYVTRPKNDFERVYLRHRPLFDYGDIEGMRLSLLKDELVINIVPAEFKDKRIAGLIDINIKNKKEHLRMDNIIDHDQDDQYGDRFHILHGYHDDKEYVKNFLVSRLSESGSLLAYNKNFKQQYAFGEDETIAYIDSASSRNSAAFISRKKYQYHSSENISDELTLINQYDIENEKYLNICQTHEASEMISIGISDTKVYLLEILHGDEERCTKDIFSVYTIDQETGKKIGRADIVMRTGEYLEPEGNGLFYIANEYFPGNLEAGYGIMYYNEESLYKPHGYHDLGVQKKMKIMTSCNNLMPCSQYIESGAFREEIEQDEVLIHIIGIDWISNNKIAFTYTTYEERPEWRIEIGEYFDHQGLIYHIDIIDLSAGPIANAFDTLNFRELELDMRTKCHSKHEWIVSRPHSLNGKRLTCTDKYIAVPVELSPVSFEKEIHKESVIALFDRTTLEYVSFIELGKDLNKDESISIVRPDDITICNDSEPIYIDLKMNAEIIDITSDCSQIAVSYIMSYGHENNTDEDQVDEGAHSFMYIEVFEDTMETKECHKVRIPVCDRAKSRDWKVGI